MKSCLTCDYWAGKQSSPNVRSGLRYDECRRHAPVLLVLCMPAQYPETHFPITNESQWCGDYAASPRAPGSLAGEGA